MLSPRPWHVVSLSLMLPLLGGCTSLGTLQTADTLGKGKSRWNYQLMAQTGQSEEHREFSMVVSPQVAVGYQYGLSDGLDVGGRVFNVGGELSAKVQLFRAENTRPVLSVAPVLGAIVLSPGRAGEWGAYASLPLLFGWETHGGSQLVLGVRPMWMRFASGDAAGSMLVLGGSAGYAFRVSPSVYLMPEVSMARSLEANVPLTPSISTLHMYSRGTLVQLGFSLMVE